MQRHHTNLAALFLTTLIGCTVEDPLDGNPGGGGAAGSGGQTSSAGTNSAGTGASGGASAPSQQDSASNDTAPPAGSGAQQFEDFCAQNPGAC